MLAHFPSIVSRHAIWNAIWSDVVTRIGHSTFQNVAPPRPWCSRRIDLTETAARCFRRIHLSIYST